MQKGQQNERSKRDIFGPFTLLVAHRVPCWFKASFLPKIWEFLTTQDEMDNSHPRCNFSQLGLVYAI